MNQSVFDPAAFMQTAVTGALDTKIPQWPVGEYLARITKVEVNLWESQAKGTSGLRADIWLETDDPRVVQAGARNLIYGIMLDLTETGQLDMGKGKNTRLGKLREAVDQNDPTQPWSFPMLEGRVLRVQVEHDMYKGEAKHQVQAIAHV